MVPGKHCRSVSAKMRPQLCYNKRQTLRKCFAYRVQGFYSRVKTPSLWTELRVIECTQKEVCMQSVDIHDEVGPICLSYTRMSSQAHAFLWLKESSQVT